MWIIAGVESCQNSDDGIRILIMDDHNPVQLYDSTTMIALYTTRMLWKKKNKLPLWN